MEASFSLAAPAKINLSLRIVRRREDGFHEIETRMTPLSLADELHFALQEPVSSDTGLQFSCSDTSVPVDGSNLVLKAAKALEEKVGELPALKIHLEKRVPHGAGLGGGSSDAAATLVGLNRWLELGLSQTELVEIAAQFGSDIPFFVYGKTCDCTGRGEFVTPVPHFTTSLPVMLLKPPFGVPTPWAYQQWRDSREIPGVLREPQQWGEVTLVNDLERPVFAKFLLLADLKMWLLQQPEVGAALMSGSGSTMFAVLQDLAHAEAVAKRARAEFGPDLWIWSGWAGQKCETAD